MKAYLVFKLPEEHEEFKLAQDALSLSCALEHIANYLRHEIKYADHVGVELEVLNKVRSRFWEILEDHDVKL